MTDRGYLNLLSHLTRVQPTLQLPTLQSSIAYYLAHTAPSPTPLAASVVSSPFFLKHQASESYTRLDALATAFRHAVHIKIKLLKEHPAGLFTRGTKASVAEWSSEVLRGLQGGRAALRLACHAGLLQGLGDWEEELKARDSRMRRRVEEEFVVALAEVMDLFTATSSAGWEKEFTHESQGHAEEGVLQLTFLITARALPLVQLNRLRVLPLASLIRLLLSVFEESFQGGTFLRRSILDNYIASSSASVPHTSPHAATIHALSKSLLLSNMASLSGMCSQLLSVLADYRPAEAWPVMQETTAIFAKITETVEADWLKTSFAHIVDEDELDREARELAKQTWIVLKTLLFTTIRISQSVLMTVVYVPQPPASRTQYLQPSPYTFALTTLHTLSHLAFVLPQFGGVSSTSSDGGFPELKRAFYTALDVLSADQLESARFVHELRESMISIPKQPVKVYEAKKAYALACAEQLVKVLGEESVKEDVYPLCAPHLDDPTNRETFESAHSVMLAIFAAHVQKSSENPIPSRASASSTSEERNMAFAEYMVPFYTRCLIENSPPTKLTPTQLRLAFRALVRSASTMHDGDAFAWFCIDSLLKASRSVTNAEHEMSMYLALVASVSSVSLNLLPRVLGAVLEVLDHLAQEQHPDERAEELVHALFEEISESVGGTEKEFAMSWWDENKERLREAVIKSRGVGNSGTDSVENRSFDKGKGKGKEVETMSRL